MISQITIGRPYSVLTAAQAAALWAEYNDRPFNISARARALGIKPSTLGYHVRGGASAQILRNHWMSAAKLAYQSAKRGEKAKAAEWFREAAIRIEKTNTTQ